MYQFLDKNNRVLYIGKAKDLKKRVASYFGKEFLLGDKTRAMVSQIAKIKITVVESELESLLLEANLIKKYLPKYNTRLTDNKAYLLTKITVKDKYPKVLLDRRMDDKNALYFGPFPSSKTLRTVLKIIRRVFPYQSVSNHAKRVCLYHHLNLCPCPAVFDSPKLKEEYRQNIRHIIQFLSGEKKTVIKELGKQRDEFGKKEEFEQAKKVQEQIQAIEYITSPRHKPFEYEINPNLFSDLREKELHELKKILNEKGVDAANPERIECFDISNISGTNAVGSMVVFTHGEKDSSCYRRFKILGIEGPNDFAMMEQVLQRRIKHREWPLPDLIIIDGGKGQISAALKALGKFNAKIPVVGLAKREETIITSGFAEITLPKSSDALRLAMRIRDEAHRFAITYHRKLRSKKFIEQ